MFPLPASFLYFLTVVVINAPVPWAIPKLNTHSSNTITTETTFVCDQLNEIHILSIWYWKYFGVGIMCSTGTVWNPATSETSSEWNQDNPHRSIITTSTCIPGFDRNSGLVPGIDPELAYLWSCDTAHGRARTKVQSSGNR